MNRCQACTHLSRMLQPLLGSSGFSIIVSIALSRTRNACTESHIGVCQAVSLRCVMQIILRIQHLQHAGLIGMLLNLCTPDDPKAPMHEVSQASCILYRFSGI